jgi:hypothetical protein
LILVYLVAQEKVIKGLSAGYSLNCFKNVFAENFPRSSKRFITTFVIKNRNRSRQISDEYEARKRLSSLGIFP